MGNRYCSLFFIFNWLIATKMILKSTIDETVSFHFTLLPSSGVDGLNNFCVAPTLSLFPTVTLSPRTLTCTHTFSTLSTRTHVHTLAHSLHMHTYCIVLFLTQTLTLACQVRCQKFHSRCIPPNTFQSILQN